MARNRRSKKKSASSNPQKARSASRRSVERKSPPARPFWHDIADDDDDLEIPSYGRTVLEEHDWLDEAGDEESGDEESGDEESGDDELGGDTVIEETPRPRRKKKQGSRRGRPTAAGSNDAEQSGDASASGRRRGSAARTSPATEESAEASSAPKRGRSRKKTAKRTDANKDANATKRVEAEGRPSRKPRGSETEAKPAKRTKRSPAPKREVSDRETSPRKTPPSTGEGDEPKSRRSRRRKSKSAAPAAPAPDNEAPKSARSARKMAADTEPTPVTPARPVAKDKDRARSRPVRRKKKQVPDFGGIDLSPEMREALATAGYDEPTPVQAGLIPKALQGLDLMGQARTGTGKTAAFAIPILEQIDEEVSAMRPQSLVLVPTRELAVQVRDEIRKLSVGREVQTLACYGGKPIGKQINQLRVGSHIVVGTPGRLLDLMARGALDLSQLACVVLDEADRMLDIGFRPDIEKILRRCPTDRQTLLLSATLPTAVVRLAERYMQKPEQLNFSEGDVAVETIEQFYITVDPERKFDALSQLLEREKPEQAIIFCRTKRGADKIHRRLREKIKDVAAIHGDLTQAMRDRVMRQFRQGSTKLLVATDVVGRGIDVSGISHIINYDIPAFCDDYVHRVGRTGRMGREGVAYSLVTPEEGNELTRIEIRINRLLKRTELEGFVAYAKPEGDGEEEERSEPKPVYGRPRRRIRRAL